MKSLAQLQADFQAYVMTAADGMAAQIVGDDRAPAEVRLDVYFHAYRLRLIEVLETDFPGLAAMLGDEFPDMVASYLRVCPSTQPSVRWVGRHLPDFLASHERWLQRPALAEMAAFDWARRQAFDAAEFSVLTPAGLAAIPGAEWPELCVRLQPSVALLRLHYNVTDFTLLQSGDQLPALRHVADAVQWVVWRHDLIVRWRSMSGDEATALSVCREGGSFADVCDVLCEWHGVEAIPLRAASLLKTWATEGLLAVPL